MPAGGLVARLVKSAKPPLKPEFTSPERGLCCINLALAMHLSEHMKLPREERTAHTNLATECIHTGIKTPSACKRRARENLLKHLGVTNDLLRSTKVHACHLCENCSTAESICVNPEHLYFGTAGENSYDKDPEIRGRGGCVSGALSLKNKTKIHNPDRRSEWASLGGKAASEKLNQIKYRCLKTGFVSTAGPLACYQRARGIDTSLRERVN